MTATGRPTPFLIVLLAVAGTLLAVAILVWGASGGGERVVVLDLPAAPAPPAATGDGADEGQPDMGAPEAEAEPAAVAPPGPDDEVEAEAAVDTGGPAFFEMPMQVVRRSNIRARPTPGSAALGSADEGAMVILVDPEPSRGYYRIATGELEGWIWGANLVPADPSQQPDAPEAADEEASPAASE